MKIKICVLVTASLLALLSLADGSEISNIGFRPIGNFQVATNPTAFLQNSVLYINFSSQDDARVTIYDSHGNVIHDYVVSSYGGEIECDTSNLPKGNYTITIESESSSYEGYFTIN